MNAPHEADVVVIGGGSAGLCAAVAAARKGARVVLIERSGQLGGMGTLARVHTFCGLYHPDTTLPPRIANAGLPEEIERLMRERTSVEPLKMGRVYVLPQDPESYAALARELTAAEASLEVWYRSSCTGIERQADGSFIVSAGERAVHGRALVDCSADAIAARFLGATRIPADPAHQQRAASIFSLEGVTDGARDEGFKMRLALDIVRAVNSGDLPALAMGTASRASTRPGEIYFTTDLDPAPEDELMASGRLIAETLTRFLKRTYPEYADACGPQLAQEPGIRESSRWLGHYTLTAQDLIEGTEFPDTVAWATWPIELREDTRGPKLKFFKRPFPSAIPLSALTSAEVPGVFFAGRCLSATHEALASVRVMGTCFATGQAAGIAAAGYGILKVP